MDCEKAQDYFTKKERDSHTRERERKSEEMKKQEAWEG